MIERADEIGELQRERVALACFGHQRLERRRLDCGHGLLQLPEAPADFGGVGRGDAHCRTLGAGRNGGTAVLGGRNLGLFLEHRRTGGIHARLAFGVHGRFVFVAVRFQIAIRRAGRGESRKAGRQGLHLRSDRLEHCADFGQGHLVPVALFVLFGVERSDVGIQRGAVLQTQTGNDSIARVVFFTVTGMGTSSFASNVKTKWSSTATSGPIRPASTVAL